MPSDGLRMMVPSIDVDDFRPIDRRMSEAASGGVAAGSGLQKRRDMATATFQVLEGMERGSVFSEIETPFTIGREDDNAIQLNDERVSRFHLKIQEDGGKVILTDLESTNGTRVNGVPTTMRTLQIGDLISIGRCLLVYGDSQQIADRFRGSNSPALQRLREVIDGSRPTENSDVMEVSGTVDPGSAHPSDWSEMLDAAGQELSIAMPPLPDTFGLAQRAQLTDLLTFIHQYLSLFLQAGRERRADDPSGQRIVSGDDWQLLIQLELRLARMITEITKCDER
jgi:pSer/pThr/pTyr-binding forkhead associated (FHA) protein